MTRFTAPVRDGRRQRESPTSVAVLVCAATLSYAANCAAGVAAASRRVDTTAVHWIHHALFASTAATTLAALSSLGWSPNRAARPLLAAVVPLSMIPFVSAHRRAHVVLAAAAAPAFAVSVVRAWR